MAEIINPSQSSLNVNDTDLFPRIQENDVVTPPELNLPQNPFSSLSSTSQPQTPTVYFDEDRLSSSLEQAKQKYLSSPFYGSKSFETPEIPGYEAAKQSDYFSKIGVAPGMDVEETYGKAQTNWNKLSNAVFGSGTLALNQAKDQFTSWGDTLSIFKGESPFKQAELEAINTWQNDFNNKYHIFQTQEDRNTFFNVSNFANMVQQSGYAIGAVLEMAAEEFALSGLTAATFGGASELQALRTLQLSSKIGKVINRTRELEKSLQGTSTLRKIFNSSVAKFINPLEHTTEFVSDLTKIARIDASSFGAAAGLARTTARGFGSFYSDLRMINAGITEAKSTVAPVMEDAYNAALEDFEKTNGYKPSEEVKRNLKEKAFNTVQTEGAVQAVWIALTDKIAFDGVLRTFKATRFLDDGLVAKGIFKNTEKAIKEGGELFVEKEGLEAFTHQLKTSPIQTLLKVPIEYAKENIMEGLQETGQDVIDSATKQWYLYNYGTDEQRKTQKDINDFLYTGAKEQLTMDGLKTFMSGFLTGGILNVLGAGLRGGMNMAERIANSDGYKESVERANAERRNIVTQLNEATNNKTDFYRSLVEINSAMVKSAKEGNKKEYWDHRNDFINKYVLSLVKSGLDDVVIDRMKEAVNDLTVDEFKQAFKGSVYEGLSEADSKDKMLSFLSTFEEKVKQVKDTHEDIKNNYGNPYNPKKYKIGTQEYNDELANYMAADEAINQMSFTKSTYLDIAKRQREILSSIKGYFPNMSFNSLYALTSPSITLKNELELLQKEYEATTDPKLKEQKKSKIDILTKYSKSVKDYNNRIKNANYNRDQINTIKNEFLKENSKLLNDILAIDNPDAVGVSTDTLHKSASDIFDYLQLQSDYENALGYFNVIANPGNFESLHQAHLKEFFNNLQKIKDGLNVAQDDADKKSIEIEVTDKSGNKQKITLIEGDEYITESNPTRRVMPKSGKVITTYDQDIIKINNLDFENKTVTITVNNAEEAITYTLDEFSEISGKLWNLRKMDPEAALFFRNRDRVIVIKVNKTNGLLHRIDGDNAKKDYSNNSDEVFAMIKYDKDTNNPSRKILYFDYKTKDGKSHRVPFDINYYNKYGVKTNIKYNLRLADTEEEYIKKKNKERKTELYNRQVEIFELLIKEQEEKTGLREERKRAIEKQLEDIKNELNDAEELATLANDEINSLLQGTKKKLSSKQKRELASLKSLIIDYNQKLDSLKNTSTLLEAEKKDIEEELKVLNDTSEFYYQALDELSKSSEPYLRSGVSNTIYGTEQEELNTVVENRPINYIPVDDFKKVLNSLNLEKIHIENKLEIVNDTIKRVEKLISRFIKYDDIINAIIGTDPTSNRSKKELQAALVKLKTKESGKQDVDNEKITLINNLLSGLNTRFKGFDNQVFRKEILEAISFINLFSIAKQEKQKLEDQLNFANKEIETISVGKEYTDKNIIPLQTKIEYLKNIEKALLDGQSKLQALNLIQATTKTVKAPTKDAAIQFSEYSDIMQYDEIKNGYDEKETDVAIIDFDKPLLLTALYKTAGRHYENLNTQQSNEPLSPEMDRFFTFTSNQPIADNNYYLIPITENNDKYGIVQKSYFSEKLNANVEVKDDIKLLVCKKVAGKYIPVDKYGKELSEENQTKDNLVFNSMLNHPEIMNDNEEQILAYLKDPNQNTSFSITKPVKKSNGSVVKEQMSDEEILREINTFKKFRTKVIEDIKNNIPVSPFKVIKKSIGKQRRVPLDVTTNKPQELPLNGRLIENNPDFKDLRHPDGTPVMLRVSTLKSGIANTIKEGRIVIQKGDTFYQVYNGRLTDEEKENIFNVLLALLPMFGRKYVTEERKEALKKLYDSKLITLERLQELTTPLTKDEQDQFELGLKYLMNTVYWSQPKDGGKIGDKQFYINKGSLFVGNKEYKFEINGGFNLENIIAAKDEIMNIASKDEKGEVKKDADGNIIYENMFHGVNSKSIDKKDDRFKTVKVINGVITLDKTYTNYLEYLLSSKRENEKPIIYTNIVEYNPNEPQLANSYLIYNHGYNDQSKPVIDNASAQPTTPQTIPDQNQSDELETQKIDIPLDLKNIPKNEKIIIRKKYGPSKKIIDFYGVWDGKIFKIEKVYNITDNKDVTSTILENMPNTITETIDNILNYASSTNPDIKNIYNELLSDFISISKEVSVPKSKNSKIKSDVEKLIKSNIIQYIDDTTGAKC